MHYPKHQHTNTKGVMKFTACGYQSQQLVISESLLVISESLPQHRQCDDIRSRNAVPARVTQVLSQFRSCQRPFVHL